MRSPAEALAEILDTCAPLGAEQVDLSAALGRVLVRPIVAARSLPPWDNSAMDGYAVRAADLGEIGAALPVVGTIAAGQVAARPLGPREAMRIMTGAPVPEGADAVIMHEEASEVSGEVRFRVRPAAGDHVRRAGEDVAPGQEVLAAGAALGPGELGLLAALGHTLCEVHRRPQVAIVSTGDELVPAHLPPGPGQIVGSNSHALAAQVRQAGCAARVLPLCPDDRTALRRTFEEALGADVVLSSGGVSVGAFDFVKEVLAELGVVERFWQVGMKPGKPLSFGTRGRVPVFGLPGNPASSMVSFELFARPALLRLLGFAGSALLRPIVPARLLSPIVPDQRRIHFLRALAFRDEAGALIATPASRQGSGMLRSMIGINALLAIAPGDRPIAAGTAVPAHLLSPV